MYISVISFFYFFAFFYTIILEPLSEKYLINWLFLKKVLLENIMYISDLDLFCSEVNANSGGEFHEEVFEDKT